MGEGDGELAVWIVREGGERVVAVGEVELRDVHLDGLCAAHDGQGFQAEYLVAAGNLEWDASCAIRCGPINRELHGKGWGGGVLM